MNKFQKDLEQWKEMEERVMNLLNNNWFNLIQNPNEKEMDLLIIEKGIEIKYDVSAEKYWNFYIEFECNWIPSGLYKQESVSLSYWAHTDWKTLYLLNGKTFRRWAGEKIVLCRGNKSLTHKWFRVVENWWDWWRTKGLLVPVEKLKEQADLIYNL